jgi:hypothetical protein
MKKARKERKLIACWDVQGISEKAKSGEEEVTLTRRIGELCTEGSRKENELRGHQCTLQQI